MMVSSDLVYDGWILKLEWLGKLKEEEGEEVTGGVVKISGER